MQGEWFSYRWFPVLGVSWLQQQDPVHSCFLSSGANTVQRQEKRGKQEMVLWSCLSLIDLNRLSLPSWIWRGSRYTKIKKPPPKFTQTVISSPIANIYVSVQVTVPGVICTGWPSADRYAGLTCIEGCVGITGSRLRRTTFVPGYSWKCEYQETEHVTELTFFFIAPKLAAPGKMLWNVVSTDSAESKG